MVENTVIQLFLALGVILIAAKAAGYLSRRLGQPAVLGELLAGITLGPSLLNMLGWSVFTDTHLPETIQHIAEIGVLLLMFTAGLEINLDEVRRVGKIAIYSGTMGVIAPILLAVPVALLAGYPLIGAAFIGMSMAATSVSISAQTMLELNVLRSQEGIAMLGAAIIDDILAILLLSILIALSVTGGGFGEIASVVVRLILFIVIAVIAGWIVLPRLANSIHKLPITGGTVAFAIASAMLLGWAAEALGGMAAITGAFIAGVCISQAKRDVRHIIEEGVRHMNYGLLVPIFFISIGLKTDLRNIHASALPFAIALFIAAVLSKILGGGLGARLGGFDNRSALRVGAGMVSRGEVGLIIGSVGLQSGLISAEVFPEIVLVILATTLVTPPLVRWAFQQRPVQPINVSTEKV